MPEPEPVRLFVSRARFEALERGLEPCAPAALAPAAAPPTAARASRLARSLLRLAPPPSLVPRANLKSPLFSPLPSAQPGLLPRRAGPPGLRRLRPRAPRRLLQEPPPAQARGLRGFRVHPSAQGRREGDAGGGAERGGGDSDARRVLVRRALRALRAGAAVLRAHPKLLRRRQGACGKATRCASRALAPPPVGVGVRTQTRRRA